jgi:hypothetical protein
MCSCRYRDRHRHGNKYSSEILIFYRSIEINDGDCAVKFGRITVIKFEYLFDYENFIAGTIVDLFVGNKMAQLADLNLVFEGKKSSLHTG